MAKKQLTILIDDLTGKELAAGTGETIQFAIDGNSYELDVDSKGADKLRSSLAPYVAAGRRVAGSRRQSVRRVSTAPYVAAGRRVAGSRRQSVRRVSTAPDPAAVRAWAAANGVEVSNRGRISASVVEQFHAAGN